MFDHVHGLVHQLDHSRTHLLEVFLLDGGFGIRPDTRRTLVKANIKEAGAKARFFLYDGHAIALG